VVFFCETLILLGSITILSSKFCSLTHPVCCFTAIGRSLGIGRAALPGLHHVAAEFATGAAPEAAGDAGQQVG